MTLIDVLPEGKLYYYESPFDCVVWVVVGTHSVVVAYDYCEGPEKIRRLVQVWDRALKDRVKPKLGENGAPVYGATEDPQTKTLCVAWFSSGDWYGLAWHLPLPRRRRQLPRGWPDDYRDRIEQLATERESNDSTRSDA